MNSILGDGGEKERGDHRHHAVDAVAIALTSRSIVKRMSDSAQRRMEERGRSRGWWNDLPMPWDSFLEDVKEKVGRIVVSHRVSRRVRGQLHDDTVYSAPRKDKEGKEYVAFRKPLTEAFKAEAVEKIVDPRVREAVREWLEKHGNDPKKAFGDPANHPRLMIKHGPHAGRTVPIHSVRLMENRGVESIGQAPHDRYVWARSNSHIEIFGVLDGDGEITKWKGRVVSRLEAYRRLKGKKPIVDRDGGPMTKFLFSLTQGDTIEVDMESPERDVLRLVYVVRGVWEEGGKARIESVHVTDARKKQDIPRSRSEKEWARFRWTPFAERLRKSDCKKISLTPLGEVVTAND